MSTDRPIPPCRFCQTVHADWHELDACRIAKAPPDALDLKLLATMSRRYAFARGSAQDRRCSDLAKRGFLERENQEYRVSAGRRSIEFRWAYRITAKGEAATKPEKVEVTS